jgi:uncharacterized tellurite resistance protein B-like protein
VALAILWNVIELVALTLMMVSHAQTIRKLAEVLGVEPRELVHKGGQNG